MAKIKISELAKELACESKDLLGYLQEKGIETAKRSTSSIEDAEADQVRKHFGKAAGKTLEKKEEKAAVSEEVKTAEHNTETGAEQPQKKKKKIIFVSNPGNSKISGTRPVQENHSAPRQPQTTQSGNGGNNNNNNNRSRSGFAASQNVYHPIKPKTAPSQLESYDTVITKTEVKPAEKTEKASETKAAPVQKQAAAENVQAAAPQTAAPETKAAPEAKAAPENRTAPETKTAPETRTAPAQNTAPSAPSARPSGERYSRQGSSDNNTERRPYNNNRDGQSSYNRNGQGGGYNRGGQGGSYGNRDGQGGGYNRGGQGGFSGRPSFGNNAGRGGQGRPGRQGGNDFADTPIKDAEKHRDEEKRRIGQEKDKRSRKDLAYEEDESKMPRSKRVGRFIKPEVKKVVEPEEQIKVISIPEKLTIKELAEKMRMQPAAIIKKLFLSGQIVTVNSELTYEEAENIAIDYDIICEKEIPVDVIEELLKEDEDAPETLVKRPPVVCVMGHVDHGKTSLLDAIRNTSVTSREAGGITQKIGAYTVSVQNQKITFLDTPGHEAFTAMRMRGANSTDIAVLVVAADDGVMPQTIEAINHAKAAKVEIIVAVNKIDKPNANVDRVKQEMTEYGLVATDWGGTTEFVPVSAKTGEGIDTLLETILLTADILELKANPDRQARGLVLEAKLDKGRGPVANVLIQKGTLHVGDFISAGACSGKVRAMADDKGKRVKEALPSQPVEILGLSDVPNAGEVILGHESDKEAKQYADTYLQQHKKDLIDETKAKMSLDDLYSKIEEGKLKELDIIIKADVQGSVEALKQSLMKLSNEEVVVKVIHGGVGAINESDVTLAAASSAIIIGFDVRPDATAKSMAEHEGVEIKLYKVIYQAIEDVDAAMKGMLAPVYEEKVIGHAEVRQIFKASSIGNIAGSFVTDGLMQKGCSVRITRDGEQIFEGKLASLKRFKDDVKEVKEGFECGLVFEDFDQIQELDVVEAYTMVEVPRE